ncbi:MAG: hypothetical protein U1E50_02150 [Caulobacteraceae bacterium]
MTHLFGDRDILELIITPERAAAMEAGLFMAFEGRQYQIAAKTLLDDGNYKVRIIPTGRRDADLASGVTTTGVIAPPPDGVKRQS